MPEPVIEEISLVEFEAHYVAKGRVTQYKKLLYERIFQMAPGQAIKIVHYDCKGKRGCGIAIGIGNYARCNISDRTFRVSHMPEGYLGVACYDKEAQND